MIQKLYLFFLFTDIIKAVGNAKKTQRNLFFPGPENRNYNFLPRVAFLLIGYGLFQ